MKGGSIGRACVVVALMWAAGPCAAAAPARELAGTVTKVTDGDSLWLQPSVQGPAVEVRLVGIDAPEICQAWGTQARDALKALVEGKQVTLHVAGVDEYRRTLGTLMIDGLKVNTRLVEEGHAWSIRTKWDRGPLVKEERMAKALSRGLHSQSGAVTPQEFRRSHGPCLAGESGVQIAPPPAALPPSVPVLVPAPRAATAPDRATGRAYAESAFKCDGRTYCSQMRSCEEATYFLRNCPGVKMDGDHDGVPCEQQWCGR